METTPEALARAAAEAWEAQLAWEEAHEAAGGVPYSWETRERALCHRVCLALGLPVPEGLRHFPSDVQQAVEALYARRDN